MLHNVLTKAATVRKGVATIWRWLRDCIVAMTPNWIPLATVAMFLVAMPPILLDLWFTGLQFGVALCMRCCIATTKVALASPFYRVRKRVMALKTKKEPTRLDRFLIDGPLYSVFHATLFVTYGYVIHTFVTPLDIEGTKHELIVLMVGGFITGPFWMRHIFDYLHEKETRL